MTFLVDLYISSAKGGFITPLEIRLAKGMGNLLNEELLRQTPGILT
jgi:hypothetical protein